MGLRTALAKAFARLAIEGGAGGAGGRYGRMGTAVPQAHAMFVKAMCLRRLGKTVEALVMMEQVCWCAGVCVHAESPLSTSCA